MSCAAPCDVDGVDDTPWTGAVGAAADVPDAATADVGDAGTDELLDAAMLADDDDCAVGRAEAELAAAGAVDVLDTAADVGDTGMDESLEPDDGDAGGGRALLDDEDDGVSVAPSGVEKEAVDSAVDGAAGADEAELELPDTAASAADDDEAADGVAGGDDDDSAAAVDDADEPASALSTTGWPTSWPPTRTSRQTPERTQLSAQPAAATAPPTPLRTAPAAATRAW